MSGTKEGAAKAAKTNKMKYGLDFYAKIGAQSWRNPERSHETGFALLSPEERKRLGAIGGKKNKGKKYVKKIRTDDGTTEALAILQEEMRNSSEDS